MGSRSVLIRCRRRCDCDDPCCPSDTEAGAGDAGSPPFAVPPKRFPKRDQMAATNADKNPKTKDHPVSTALVDTLSSSSLTKSVPLGTNPRSAREMDSSIMMSTSFCIQTLICKHSQRNVLKKNESSQSRLFREDKRTHV